ncbi:hypothetical protein BCR33DRAFT_712379 [Rhizoclosmatium globosum]|uniref:Tyrosine specific protein phosphatases domain-containing protein n=1 Tax=Rhizoclosmatium globosum TaxID=329046 RepID=A0A1Y2CWB7_9FUNG|nr:hypothetical protein BCR33DRAFT_712379 [Rhizoclosmatium globosum]|eukprot:ORY51277.1 hypothetical protein BCR33DRAFT_712379 [Rhizoclosmatium globosum]
MPMNRVMSTIDYKNMRFVVFDAPTDSNLEAYLDELSTLDRVVEKGIQVTDWGFADGTIPPPHVVTGFLNLCNDRFPGGLAATAGFNGDAASMGVKAIGIHCVAGLGRAPILVAIALIESGMKPIEAVEYVRARRRGAFNTVQLNYLVDGYKPHFLKKGGLVAKGSFGFGFGGVSKKERSPSPTGSVSVPDVEAGNGVAAAAAVAVGAATGNGAAAPVKGFKSWFTKK